MSDKNMPDHILTIELVPSPLWGKNLRSHFTRDAWDTLRKSIYKKYNYTCSICGATNEKMHCHEVWQYDDEKGVQTLVDLTAICEMCHHVKHLGHASILATEGKISMPAVIEHFCRVNHCSHDEYARARAEAFALWRRRSEQEWTQDIETFFAKIESRH